MNGSTLTTTPGIYYAIAYWLGCNIMIMNSNKRISNRKTALIQSILLILLSVIMVWSDGTVVFFVPFIILYLVLIFLSIYINCNYNGKTAFYFAVRAFIIGEFTASLVWQVIFYSLSALKLPQTRLFSGIISLVVYGIVFYVFYMIEKKSSVVNSNLEVHTREWVSVLIIGVAIFCVSNLSYTTNGSLFSSQFSKEIFIIRTLVDLGGVAILYAYHIQLGELNTRLEVERLQSMLNMQYSNYEMLEKSISTVNQKYHDLKYQIAYLKQDIGEEERRHYLDQLEQEIKVYEAQNKTGNKVLDTLLTSKKIYCQSNWIELTSVVEGAAIDFLNEMDISTLFGNILDNAIESVMKIEKKERRLIHLAVAKQKGFLRIRAENCYEEEPVFENGLPITTKLNKKYHGFGLKSIQSTVKKYEGSFTINAENGWFELRILIPLP